MPDFGKAERKIVVFDVLSRDFAYEQVRAGSHRDAVTLIVFKDGQAEVVFDRRALTSDLVTDLRMCGVHLTAHGDGNYRPALDLVEKRMLADQDYDYALVCAFLSDGSPSDSQLSSLEYEKYGVDTNELRLFSLGSDVDLYLHKHLFTKKMRHLRATCGSSRFRAITVGVGAKDVLDFVILEAMAKSVKGQFFHSSLAGAQNSLRQIFKTISSTLTDTKTALSEQSVLKGPRTDRSDIVINKTSSSLEMLAGREERRRVGEPNRG